MEMELDLTLSSDEVFQDFVSSVWRLEDPIKKLPQKRSIDDVVMKELVLPLKSVESFQLQLNSAKSASIDDVHGHV